MDSSHEQGSHRPPDPVTDPQLASASRRLETILRYEPETVRDYPYFISPVSYYSDVCAAADRITLGAADALQLEGTRLEVSQGECEIVDAEIRTQLGTPELRSSLQAILAAAPDHAALSNEQVAGALENVITRTLYDVAQVPRREALRSFRSAHGAFVNNVLGSDWESRGDRGELEVPEATIAAAEQAVSGQAYELSIMDYYGLSGERRQKVATLISNDVVQLCKLVARYAPHTFSERPEWFTSYASDAPSPILRQNVRNLESALTYYPNVQPDLLIAAFMEGRTVRDVVIQHHRVSERHGEIGRQKQSRRQQLLAKEFVQPEVLERTPGTSVHIAPPDKTRTLTETREAIQDTMELLESDLWLQCADDALSEGLDTPYRGVGWEGSVTRLNDKLFKDFWGAIFNARINFLPVDEEYVNQHIAASKNAPLRYVTQFAILAEFKSSGRPSVARGIKAMMFARREPSAHYRSSINLRVGEVLNAKMLRGILKESRAIGWAVLQQAYTQASPTGQPGSGRRR